MQHYSTCWEVRNKVFYDEQKQREFIIKWCMELKAYLEETKEFQVEWFLHEYKIDFNKTNVNNMKDWIRSAKKIRKNCRIYKKGEIRRYFYKKRKIKCKCKVEEED